MGEVINLVNNFKVKKVIFNCVKFNYIAKRVKDYNKNMS